MTAALEVGDRVRVEFDGTVIGKSALQFRPYCVRREGSEVGPSYWLDADCVTRITPAEPVWKVGDAITIVDVDGEHYTSVFIGTGWRDHEGDTWHIGTVSRAWHEGRVTRLVPEVQALSPQGEL